jgi:hypothetical protein
MWTLNLKGVESLRVSQKLKLPDIFTLALQPVFYNADFTEAYERCNSPIVRDLLERVPLKGGYKYTIATSMIQFLSPDTSSIQNADWHLDPGVPAPHRHDARIHILSAGNDLTSTTRFIKEDVDVELPDELYEARHRVLRQHLTENADRFGFESVAVEQDRFVTFTNLHPHIALPPQKYELRYFMRVQESDIEPPREFKVVDSTATLIRGSDKMVATLEQRKDGIFLRYV